MERTRDGRYLIAACPHPRAAGDWEFFFINTTAQPVDGLVVETAGAEWGDTSWIDSAMKDKSLGSVGAGGWRAIWTCDSDAAEVNPWLTVRLRTQTIEERLMFEFPKLYKIKSLERVPILDRDGYICHGVSA